MSVRYRDDLRNLAFELGAILGYFIPYPECSSEFRILDFLARNNIKDIATLNAGMKHLTLEFQGNKGDFEDLKNRFTDSPELFKCIVSNIESINAGSGIIYRTDNSFLNPSTYDKRWRSHL